MHVLTLTASPDAPFHHKQLDALERRGVTTTVLSVPGEVGADASRSPIDYVRFVPQVRRAVSAGEYDLIHAHFGLTAPAALAQRRLPVVLSLWGTDLHGPAGRLSATCARRCDAVVVMSEEMSKMLDCESVVVPDGVDLEQFAPIAQFVAKTAVGWDGDGRRDDPNGGGRRDETNGRRDERIDGDRGPGDDHEGYDVLFPYPPERAVKNHPRARRIVDAVDQRFDRPVRLRTVHGVDHDEVVTYMNAADALLLTSDHEGSPNAVKEAMACNLPVVSTDVGDVAERLAGVYPSAVASSDDELVDALELVLASGERSNGRERVREVSIERTADRLVDVYESVLAGEAVASPPAERVLP